MLYHLKPYPWTVFIYIALSAFTLSNVLCTPVPVSMHPEDHECFVQMNSGYYPAVSNAYTNAQGHLANLLYIWDDRNTQFKLHKRLLLELCFGRVGTADAKVIAANIVKLASLQSVVRIADLMEAEDEDNWGLMAYTSPIVDNRGPSVVTFTAIFHQVDEVTQAAVVIHESTHALLDTVDAFSKKSPYKPMPDAEYEDDKTKFLWGFEGIDFKELTQKAAHQTKHNADSYTVAAILATRIIGLTEKKDIEAAIYNSWALPTTAEAVRVKAENAANQASGSSSKGKGKGKSSGHSRGIGARARERRKGKGRHC